ncbi:DUF5700 domain-containing putative Zn-dependent protease [Novacetimonas maltaceti]|uniref:Peptidase MA-like domain-containing protein n=1 Tax=Novacetimonas maltaceti TaxID=1203393 RepID=A0A2S3W179_9PROT|nr:DUF5700 domain-containing putative Zn-dependent protease [Novacetimonas maltaceti]POF62635.1 hypothetical protein KMAL_17560 [Novacetimonas maltaceti]
MFRRSVFLPLLLTTGLAVNASAAMASGTSSAIAVPTIILDTRGASEWVRCMRAAKTDIARCNARSAATDGGKLAELSVPTFGTLPPGTVTQPSVQNVQELLDSMNHWPMYDIARDVGAYVPPLKGSGHILRIFVVGNGAPLFSDMYVRHFSWRHGMPFLNETSGDPVMLIDARQVVSYGNTGKNAADIVEDVLHHEMFHIYFSWYRTTDVRWQSFMKAMTPEKQLLLDVQDEGIAHYLGDPAWKRTGFPRAHGQAAMDTLGQVILAFKNGTVTPDMLQKANEGPFWEKYADIAGGLFATGIDHVFGKAAVRQSVQDGPACFILKYDAATRQDPGLLPLTDTIRQWARQSRWRL